MLQSPYEMVQNSQPSEDSEGLLYLDDLPVIVYTPCFLMVALHGCALIFLTSREPIVGMQALFKFFDVVHCAVLNILMHIFCIFIQYIGNINSQHWLCLPNVMLYIFKKCICLFLAVLGLCCAGFSVGGDKQGPLPRCDAQASHCGSLSCCRAWALGCAGFSSWGMRAPKHWSSSCGTQAQLLQGMWDLPRPRIKPVSPALTGRLSLSHKGSPCFPFQIATVTFLFKKLYQLSFLSSIHSK